MINRKKRWLYFFLSFVLIILLATIGFQEYRTAKQEKRLVTFIDNVQAYQDSIYIEYVKDSYKD
jgi:uncharacterized membrane protein SirB2